MSKLERMSPLGRGISATAYSSEFVSLRQQTFFGVAKVIVRKSDLLGSPELEALLGVRAPQMANTVVQGSGVEIAWAAPNQWLLLGDEAEVARICAAAQTAFRDETALVLQLTHAYAVFQIEKTGARDVLASLCPLDLHPRAFAPGRCAQSLLGDAGVFIQQCNEAPSFRLMVDQTYAGYAWRLLSEACKSLSSS